MGKNRLHRQTQNDNAVFTDYKQFVNKYKYKHLNVTKNQYNGKKYEELIVRLLRIYGLSIVARNVNLHFTEIDIVATYGVNMYVVEVRSRKTKEAMFVDYKKLYKVIYGARVLFPNVRKVFNVKYLHVYVAFVVTEPSLEVKFVSAYDLI